MMGSIHYNIVYLIRRRLGQGVPVYITRYSSITYLAIRLSDFVFVIDFAFVVHLKSEMLFQHAAVGMVERRFRAMVGECSARGKLPHQPSSCTVDKSLTDLRTLRQLLHLLF